MEDFFFRSGEFIGNGQLGHCSGLIAAVDAAACAEKKYVCLLWLVVLFRLLCPVTLESQFSLVPQHQTIQPEIVYTTPQVQTAAAPVNVIADKTVNPVLRQTSAPNPQGSVNPLQSVFVSGGAAVGAGDGSTMRLHLNKLAAAAAAAAGSRARWRGHLSV